MSARLCVGSGGEHLAGEIERLTAIPRVDVAVREFPDGELCVRIGDGLSGCAAIILQGTHPPQHRRLQELFQLVEAAAALEARRIVCIVPYLAYARQDRRTTTGEPQSCEIVLRTLAMLGADELICVEAHNPAALGTSALHATSVSAAALFADWVERLDLARPVLLSPDAGGRGRVEAVGRLTGVPALALSKTRAPDGATWFRDSPDTLRERDVVVLDDVCSTGSTIAPLARWLGDRPSSLAYGVTHLLADPADLRSVVGRPLELYATDTVPGPPPRASVATLIAPLLLRGPSHSDPARSHVQE